MDSSEKNNCAIISPFGPRVLKKNTMNLILFLIHIYFCYFVHSYDSDSIESFNGIEVSPFYDAIIFSDIAEIINQFDNNNIQLPKNESESDENIDDLLSEYQHYLEKAHKQTKDYIEKTRLKNKVPAMRHDRYYKPNIFRNNMKQNEFYHSPGYYGPEQTPIKYPQSYNPLDLFLPFNPKGKQYLAKDDDQRKITVSNFEMNPFRKIILNEENRHPISGDIKNIPLNSACYCKTNQLPCSCGCKQCLLPINPVHQNNAVIKILNEEGNNFEELKNHQKQNYVAKLSSAPEDTINIRIKVDVQLPNTEKRMGQSYNYKTDVDKNSNEYMSPIKLPSSYLNFPIPMNVFGYKKSSMESTPFHKITVHKKKKSKGNSNKRHKKKLITIHNIKLEPQIVEEHFGKINISINNTNNESKKHIVNSTQNIDRKDNITQKNIKYLIGKSKDAMMANNMDKNVTQTESNLFLLVNISHNILNGTDDMKTGSVEIDYTNTILNATTDKSLHSLKKREVSSTKKQVQTTTPKLLTAKPTKIGKNINNKTNLIKKSEKSMPTDIELLYWPKNKSVRNIATNNITTIIIENEFKKSKLNLSNDSYKNNHTRVLEKAIFGDVDWNDVHTVAPAFMSFVGKYVEGVLTFCSNTVCHSMKCEKKKCLYRVCNPSDRINNKGHCTGTNNTDSVTSLESIMDLPSKVAFELVDILEERMPGKLFGKVTICINGKCITLRASKKMFIKHKCHIKELNSTGHCTGLEAKTS